MITRRVKGVGLRQHVEETFRFDGPVDGHAAAELDAFLGSRPVAEPGDWLGDALRRENARRCRAILATVGLSDEGRGLVDTQALLAKGLDEASAQWLAAHWLAEFNTLTRKRERFEAGNTGATLVASMLFAAAEMGRLEERMWWRAGIDRDTGRKREALALAGRRQVRGGRAGAAIKGQKSFRAAFGAQAQMRAEEIHAARPHLSWAKIREILAGEFKVSPETIKKSVRNPKKTG